MQITRQISYPSPMYVPTESDWVQQRAALPMGGRPKGNWRLPSTVGWSPGRQGGRRQSAVSGRGDFNFFATRQRGPGPEATSLA